MDDQFFSERQKAVIIFAQPYLRKWCGDETTDQLMALNLADGQLAATSTTILGATGNERLVAVTLHNAAATKQTVVLTVTRAGSTARTIVYAVLKQYETHYIRGIPLDPSDILAGYATGANSVGYLVNHSPEPFAITARDEEGSPKASGALTVTLPDGGGIDAGTLALIGLAEEIRALMLKVA